LSTFITVGNGREPFERLLRAVVEVQDLLPRPVSVQCGSTKFAYPTWNVRPFLDMHEFERLIQQSNLLIMHAGAGSVINAARTAKRPIVMPRRACYGEIVDDHQIEFAEALAGQGRVILAREPADLAPAIECAFAGKDRGLTGDDAPLVQHITQLLALLDQAGGYA
jgi:UDP-N-acetylglucosamine transferase subunit ALG13